MIDAIIAAARECLGTPFKHQGRRPGVALDCAGLIVHVAQTIGADYQDVTGYGRRPHQGELERAVESQPCLHRIYTLEAGAVVLMRFGSSLEHMGIYTGGTLIHSYALTGRVVEHLMDAAWKKNAIKFYRFIK